jgi:hypothetical protein
MLQMPLLSLSYYDVARLGLLALTVHAAYVQVTSPGSYETRDYLYWIALSVIAYGSYKGEPLNRIVCAIVYAIVWPAITVVDENSHRIHPGTRRRNTATAGSYPKQYTR